MQNLIFIEKTNLNMGLFIILSFLELLSSIPIWLMLFDGHKQNNLKKGVFYVIGFFVFLIGGIFLINTFGICLAMFTPLLFFKVFMIKWLITSPKNKRVNTTYQ